jgi:hypothetical protein
VRVLHRRDVFPREVAAWFEHLDETETAALVVGVAVPSCSSCSAFHEGDPAVLVAVVGATVVSASSGCRTRSRLWARCPAASRSRRAVDIGRRCRAIVRRRGRDHARVAHRHDRDIGGVRRPTRDDVDPNQEMIGLGAANLTAGFLQGFAVSTSGSRTAVAEQSGAKSQLTGIVGAGIVVALLVLFQSLLADLPQSALAAVVIAAALSLLNLGVLRRYASVRRSSLLLC